MGNAPSMANEQSSGPVKKMRNPFAFLRKKNSAYLTREDSSMTNNTSSSTVTGGSGLVPLEARKQSTLSQSSSKYSSPPSTQDSLHDYAGSIHGSHRGGSGSSPLNSLNTLPRSATIDGSGTTGEHEFAEAAGPQQQQQQQQRKRKLGRPLTRDRDRSKAGWQDDVGLGFTSHVEGQRPSKAGGSNAKVARPQGDVPMTIDMNFDQIDDIVDSSFRNNFGASVGPKDELLQDSPWTTRSANVFAAPFEPNGAVRPGSSTSTGEVSGLSKAQYFSPSTRGSVVSGSGSHRSGSSQPGKFGFNNQASIGGASATGGSISSAPPAAAVDVRKPGLRKVTLAEAQSYTSSSSGSPRLRAASTSAGMTGTPRMVPMPSTREDDGPSSAAGDVESEASDDEFGSGEPRNDYEAGGMGGYRKASAISGVSGRSGVSPKSSVVQLTLPPSATNNGARTEEWSSRQAVPNINYEFPSAGLDPNGAVIVDPNFRKGSQGSLGAGGQASSWAAPDSWAVLPDKPEDVEGGEGTGDSDDNVDEEGDGSDQPSTSGPGGRGIGASLERPGQTRKGSFVGPGAIWMKDRSQSTTSSAPSYHASEATSKKDSLATPIGGEGNEPGYTPALDAPRGSLDSIDLTKSNGAQAATYRPHGRGGGGAMVVAGVAASKLGALTRPRQKPLTRPHTATQANTTSSGSLRNGSTAAVDDLELHPSGPHQVSPGVAAKRSNVVNHSTALSMMPMKNYIMRVETAFGARTVSIPLNTTTVELRAILARKAHQSGAGAYRLFVRDKGSERPLGDSEKPAMLHKRRLEQVGFTEADSLETLGREDHSYLLRIVYRPDMVPNFDSEQFGSTEDRYTHLDLSSRNIEMVPIFLYRHADWINSLDLSANPLTDLPSDFVQLCSNLRTLRLSNLALKRLPQSLRHSETLTHLDVSNNRIPDLSHIPLDQMSQLRSLKVQNNRLTELPAYFSRLPALTHLNLSNNRFEVLPMVVCSVQSLADLDVSFNSISVLPEEIANLKRLQSLILTSNSIEHFPENISAVSSLRKIDARRNLLADVTALCKIEALEEVQCEHNNIKAFDATFRSSLRSIGLGHNPLSKLSITSSGRSSLITLDLSAANLSKLDEDLVAHFSSLQDLILDDNQFVGLPNSLGELRELRLLSVTNNHLASLPDSLGNLTKLRRLSAHNNNLKSLPSSIWLCGSLEIINVSSNLLESIPHPPISNEGRGSESKASPVAERQPGSTILDARKGSTASSRSLPGNGASEQHAPALVSSLKKLRLGDNRLTHDVFDVLNMFTGLEVLNLSFNEIYEVPSFSLYRLTQLTELYLSGNSMSSLPTDDLMQLKKLKILHLNANRLQTLPAELGQLSHLVNLDVGNNSLKYNIANWHYDWNWNSNPALRYLNLSGNKRLEVKSSMSGVGARKTDTNDFQRLPHLRVLGLMDVTVLLPHMPDESDNRRVRTSLSQINNMSYGISDALGRFDNLNLVDVVIPNFRQQPKECVLGLFEGRGHSPQSGSRIAKFLSEAIKRHMEREISDALLQQADDPDQPPNQDQMVDILRRSFLRLQQEYAQALTSEGNRKLSEAKSIEGSEDAKNAAVAIASSTTKNQWQAGASGVLLYVVDRTLYAANAGDTLAVLSRGGTAEHLTIKHMPFDRPAVHRIRSAEGWVSLRGYVSDLLDVSRSFGYYHLNPFVTAAPSIRCVELTDSDEFVILASRSLWEHTSYQTAVDIARTERDDLMIAAQKLRDFAISYGAEESIMVQIISVGDLFQIRQQQQMGANSQDPAAEAFRKLHRRDRGNLVGDRTLARLEREVPPPVGHVALVFTDIKNSTSLWETNGGMQSAMRLHNVLLRRQLRTTGGYEVKTEGDAFMVSFPSVTSALLWCFNVQLALLREDWPQEILESEDGKEVFDASGNLMYRGLSVRMGIHWGWPVCEADPITRRMDYFGPMVNRAARISSAADGGQIMVSRDVINELTALLGTFDESGGLNPNAATLSNSGSDIGDDDNPGDEEFRLHQPNMSRDVVLLRRMGFGISQVGEKRLKGLETPELLSLMYPKQLAGRLDAREDAAAPQVFEPMPSLLNTEEIKALGMICLRLEALSNAQVHAGLLADPISAMNASSSAADGDPSNTTGTDDEAATSGAIAATTPGASLIAASSRPRAMEKHLAGRPETLLVAIRDDAPDDELANLMEQLVTRTCNALAMIMLRYQLAASAAGDTCKPNEAISMEALASLLAPLKHLL